MVDAVRHNFNFKLKFNKYDQLRDKRMRQYKLKKCDVFMRIDPDLAFYIGTLFFIYFFV